MSKKKEEFIDDGRTRKAFTFYLSFEEGLESLDEADQFALYKAISRYSLFGEEPDLSGIASSLWRLMMPTLRRQRVGFLVGEEGGQFGYLGGAQKGNQNARKQPLPPTPKTSPTPYPQNNPNKSLDNKNKNKNKEKEIIEKESTKRRAFVPPTLEEVRAYFRENGYSEAKAVEAFNYYDVANWHDATGKPIKNWKQKMIGVWFKEENRLSTLKPQSNEQAKQRHCFN